MNLDDFLHNHKLRNHWVCYYHFAKGSIKPAKARVYLRKSMRSFAGSSSERCIDIATIVCEPERNGAFTALVTELQDKTRLPLFLENTHKEFADSCRKHGWKDYPNLGDTKLGIYCLYLPYRPQKEG